MSVTYVYKDIKENIIKNSGYDKRRQKPYDAFIHKCGKRHFVFDLFDIRDHYHSGHNEKEFDKIAEIKSSAVEIDTLIKERSGQLLIVMEQDTDGAYYFDYVRQNLSLFSHFTLRLFRRSLSRRNLRP